MNSSSDLGPSVNIYSAYTWHQALDLGTSGVEGIEECSPPLCTSPHKLLPIGRVTAITLNHSLNLMGGVIGL